MKRTIIAWLSGFLPAALLLGLLGCGGEIDPAGAVRAESASSTWVIGRRGM